MRPLLCRLIGHAWGYDLFLRRDRCLRCKQEQP